MSLHIYLNRKIYLKNHDQVTMIRQGQDYPLTKVISLTEEFAYWKNAYAIHKWFVDHVQGGKDDAQEHLVYRYQLIELQETSQVVLNNLKIGKDILPMPNNGAYDEYYVSHLHRTVEFCRRALSTDEGEYYCLMIGSDHE